MFEYKGDHAKITEQKSFPLRASLVNENKALDL